jgi:hypothetical protein
LVVVLLAGATLAGCGETVGSGSTAVSLLVTRDRGATTLQQSDRANGAAGSVLSMVRATARDVEVTGGQITGLAGVRAGRGRGWFLYVNGVLTEQAPKVGSPPRLHPGDQVWLDEHPLGAGSGSPAVVGAYPDPFVHGVDGRRLPTRVECVLQSGACQTVQDDLVALGLPASKGGIAASFTVNTLRIVVGQWHQVRDDPTIGLIDRGLRAGGVFVSPSADGRSFGLLDAGGAVVRTLGAGAGLIAAVRSDDDKADPIWVVTGTDARGLQAAAQALDPGALDGRFAVAIAPGGTPIALPVRH